MKTFLAATLLLAAFSLAQAADSSIHATKTMRPDGTTSSMIVDNEKRTAEERVEDAKGKLLRVTTFMMDDSNQYFGSITADSKGTVLYRTTYKRDGEGRVDEEAVSTAEGQLMRRRVYTYGAANKVTNVTEYDANGNAIVANRKPGSGGLSAQQAAQAQPGQPTRKGKK